METRASYLVVGGFVLALFTGFLVFVAWFAQFGVGSDKAYYRLYFADSISGLSVGSPVRFRGVPVGSVSEVVIDPANMTQVRVTIEVAESTPVKTDSVASLEQEGITGGAYVNITGGSEAAARLTPEPGQDYAVLPVEQSSLAAVIDAAPKLLSNLMNLTERAQRILSEENQAAVTDILRNIGSLSQSLSASAQEFEKLAADARGTVAHADDLVTSLDGRIDGIASSAQAALKRADDALSTIDGQSRRIGDQVEMTADDLRKLIASLNESADSISAFLEKTEQPVSTFASEGLYELTALMAELRQLASNLSRLTTQFERGPGDFLFGRSRGGVKVE
ncbi:MAG: ABC transporter substrate-binding protein [Rhodospirillaceae bacterium]|nr:ABC transporter substrate-binding protein [Rhodospirillaceae bacterium]